MSAHRDRQQNPRTPHCLISVGDIKLINPRFPLTELSAPLSWSCFHSLDAMALQGTGAAGSPAGLWAGMGPLDIPLLWGAVVIWFVANTTPQGSKPGGHLQVGMGLFLPSYACRAIHIFCARNSNLSAHRGGPHSVHMPAIWTTSGDPAPHICKCGH